MIVLGSTGSIGVNSIFLAKKFNIKVNALACEKNYELLNQQIEVFKPKFIYIHRPELKKNVKHKIVFTSLDGIEAFLKACSDEFGGDTVINALVGFSGLKPSVISQKLGFKLALANKESLVVGGKFLDCKKISAIDSEHFGLNFLLKNRRKFKSLIITASGGAFYRLGLKELDNVNAKMALRHPNWDMGAKITIDSATMANKLFEVLEAFWLYGSRSVDALIERTSTVHALVSFNDGSTTAHLSKTDMKLAIAHAIGYGDCEILDSVDLAKLKNICFKPIPKSRYPIFTLKNLLLSNPDLGAIINAANEEMVYRFLRSECKFLDISKMVFKALDKFGCHKMKDLDDVFLMDKKVRQFCKREML